jgi:hypothetical protein
MAVPPLSRRPRMRCTKEVRGERRGTAFGHVDGEKRLRIDDHSSGPSEVRSSRAKRLAERSRLPVPTPCKSRNEISS